MKILAIECTGTKFSVALIKDNQNIICYKQQKESKQAEMLIDYIDSLLKKAELAYQDLDYIAISNGPGSFTAIRIGMSAAMGISLSINKPIIIVNNFETLIYRTKQQLIKFDCCIMIMNALRNQFYVTNSNEIDKIELLDFWETKTYIQELESKYKNTVLSGDGAVFFSECNSNILPRFPIADARFVGYVASEKIDKKIFDPVEPLYIKPPSVNLNSKNLIDKTEKRG